MRAKTMVVPAVIALVGISSAGSIAYVIAVSSGDPALRAEAGYYDRAVRWDDIRAMRAQWDALGWTLGAAMDDGALRVSVVDSEGEAVDGLRVRASVFPEADWTASTALELTEAADGAHSAPFEPDRHGAWVVRVRIESDAGAFDLEERVRVRRGGGA